ncbi:baeRF3 domain-containing protein [Pseudokordiimonas caeni]|uniref:baeRF3 domain-containing protein n=1 Tax=Pseudokordiimonas caeni TaxID=2997908 RepID=UPI0028121979|nr:hypothetical protein [Pseudokordiimonas caeni]
MISRSDLQSIILATPDAAVSLFMPVYQAPPEDRQNPIRLQNLMREAEKKLKERDVNPDALIAPAMKRIKDDNILAEPDTRGLALFFSRSDFQHFSVPREVGERVFVCERYVIRPLLPFLEQGGQYFLIGVTQQNSTLYCGDNSGIAVWKRDVREETLKEIRERTELPADVGFHPSGTATRGGKPAARFHAQGDSPEDYKQIQLDQFVAGVARQTDRILKDETAPLVVIADPTMLGLFRKHCTYQGLENEGIDKSPEDKSLAELHAEAWPIADKAINWQKREEISRVLANVGRGDDRAILNQDEILKRAREGRVDTLLLAADRLESMDRANRDMGDLLARETLSHGGNTFLVKAADLPGKAAVAALVRH